MVYRLAGAWTTTVPQLEEALQAARFVECGALQDKSVGWIAPRGGEESVLVEVVDGQWLLRLMVETKAVPGSVVKRKVEAQIEQIEASTGRKPGRKEPRDLKEDARMALLPLAFSRQSAVWVWVDPKAGLLMLDAGSQARADEVITALVKAVDGLAMQLLQTQMSPAAAMGLWLRRSASAWTRSASSKRWMHRAPSSATRGIRWMAKRFRATSKPARCRPAWR